VTCDFPGQELPQVTNCTIAENRERGLSRFYGDSTRVVNSIVHGNGDDTIEGPASHCLSTDPSFVRSGAYDFGRPRRATIAGIRVSLPDYAVDLLFHLYIGERRLDCLDAADLDDSGTLEITDAIRLLSYLFLGGSPPAPPFTSCGVDPTPTDGLGCAGPPGC
jgi:hypothetical protein